MSNLTNSILQSTENYPLANKKIWLACSGGRDSMALAWAVFTLYRQGKIEFCPYLIHVNHGMQSANDDWAELVKNWANSHHLPCQIVKVNLAKHDEQSARNARYQAIFEKMAEGDVLLLAHHANDQAETLLMRLFKGTGVKGLSAMQAWQPQKFQQKTIYLWRPWLTVQRAEITQFVQQHNLPYVDDPTNTQGANTRSWLRRQLLPIIKQKYPQIIYNLVRNSQLLTEANDILNEVYQQDLQTCTDKNLSLSPYDEVLNIDKIRLLSIARQRQLIHKWLQGDEPLSASKQRIDEILALVQRTDNDQQTQLNWQGKYHHYSVRRYRNQLHKLRDDWEQSLLDDKVMAIAEKKFKQKNIINRPIKKTDKFSQNSKQQVKSHKKLMQRLAIPQWQRKFVKVLEVEGEIVCVFSGQLAWWKDE